MSLRSIVDLPESTGEEGNLFSVAYKNAISARRSSWRVIGTIETKEVGWGKSEAWKNIKSAREQIESETKGMANEIVDLLDTKLIPQAKKQNSKFFYFKM